MSAPILVVDDDEGIRHVLQMCLEVEGWPVQVARNGREALTLLEGSSRRIVLLDLMMPVLDGRAVVEQVRADPARYDAPRIVLMSAGWHLAQEGHALLVPPVAATLPKPFTLTEVAQIITGLLPSC